MLSTVRVGETDNARSVETLDAALATTTTEFDSAFRLLHDRYVARGYARRETSGRRVTVHHALPTTKVFVAREAGRVVGTVTLVRDSVNGLPMDEIYRSEVTELRQSGRRIGEIGSLAIAPDVEGRGLEIMLVLVRAVLLYATEIAGLDALCIAVNPRHAAFYERVLFFERFGALRAYGKVNGAPAIALRLELVKALTLIRGSRLGAIAIGGRCDRLFEAEPCRRAIARLRRDAPRSTLSAAQRTAFFADARDTLGSRGRAARARRRSRAERRAAPGADLPL